jgi:hypothetical protein
MNEQDYYAPCPRFGPVPLFKTTFPGYVESKENTDGKNKNKT